MAKWPDRVQARAEELGVRKRTVQSTSRVVRDILSGMTNGDRLRLGFYAIEHTLFLMWPS